MLTMDNKHIIKSKFDENLLKNSCVITINFVLDIIKTDYCFFTNAKRMDYAFQDKLNNLIVTSNLVDDISNPKYVVSRNELAYHDGFYSDDSTLMLLNLLKICSAKKIYISGFDGFKKNSINFYENGLERSVREDDYDDSTRIKILRKSYRRLNIEFLTPSVYEKGVL